MILLTNWETLVSLSPVERSRPGVTLTAGSYKITINLVGGFNPSVVASCTFVSQVGERTGEGVEEITATSLAVGLAAGLYTVYSIRKTNKAMERKRRIILILLDFFFGLISVCSMSLNYPESLFE